MAEFEALDSIDLLDSDDRSLTLTWKLNGNEGPYVLQMNDDDDNDDEKNWQLLSNTLTSNSIKKKNLAQGKEYKFRIRSISSSDEGVWVVSSKFKLKTCMNAPIMKDRDSESLTLQWDVVEHAIGYRIRYRESGNTDWVEVGKVLTETSVRKKNLIFSKSYEFAVKPEFSADTSTHYDEFSHASSLMSPLEKVNLHPSFKGSLPSTLLVRENATSVLKQTEDLLAGKVIAIYFSASWCPPCRKFTPVVSESWTQAKAEKLPFEVVFASCDHDESSFLDYFHRHHPWLALPYDSESRTKLAEHFKVSGIPRLVVLNKDGKIIEDNARSVSISAVRKWCAT